MTTILQLIALAAADAGNEKYWIPILQSLFTSGLVSGILYVWQRQHKISDSLTIERNKLSAQKSMQYETEIFDLMKSIRTEIDLDSKKLIDLSGNINNLRNEYRLHISDKISEISNKFADYLLEVAADEYKRNRYEEDRLLDKFKKQFRK